VRASTASSLEFLWLVLVPVHLPPPCCARARFLTSSVVSFIVTDYVTLRFERGGKHWKDYRLLKFGFFFLGIIASAEVAAFLTAGLNASLNSAYIGWLVLLLTVVDIMAPWYYFKWKDKSGEQTAPSPTLPHQERPVSPPPEGTEPLVDRQQHRLDPDVD
jgi:hypothetical protein